MNPFEVMYRVGFAPWERRDVERTWPSLLAGADGEMPAGRALDIGCGTGRDAVYLARRGWRVTGVDFTEPALQKARQRAQDQGVDVQWVQGDVANLAELGLEPGYTLIYDMGCLHGLPDAARQSAMRAIGDLAAPRAVLLIAAFKARRRPLLPRGMDQAEMVEALGLRWRLEDVRREPTDDMPAPVRRAAPKLYRFAFTG